MPAARYWRLVAIEAHGGADLELSALHLYDAAGRADAAATIASSIAPTTGTLAALQDEDTASTCGFAAAAVRAPGFAITWDFGAGNAADVLVPRLAGPALATFLASCTLQRSDDGALWVLVADFARFDWPGAAAYTNAPAAGAPHFDKVSLLLHMDGADGSGIFADSSATPKAVTSHGNARVSTAESKLGGGSLLLDGAGSYLSAPANAAYIFGTGDFTLELFVKTTADGARALIDQYTTGYDTWQWDMLGGKLAWYHRSGGAGGYALSGSVPVNDGLWHHVAATRNFGVLRFFVDGALDGSVGDTTNYVQNVTLGIGAQVASRNSAYDFAGGIDELRITKGVARYTANFTPPAAPFPSAVGAGPVFLPPLLRAQASDRARIAASSPVPPHSTLSAPRLLLARDTEFAGSGTASATGTIYGSTAIKGTPNAPVRAKVSLLRARDLLLVQQTWSDPATGAYAFHGLDPTVTYTTLAEYPTGDYRAVAADQLVPDIEEARAS